MCEVCGNILDLVNKYISEHDATDKLPRTVSLCKQDVLNIVNYPLAWSQRQCMCCYKDTKNYEIINTLVQHTLSVMIHVLQDLSSPEGATLILRLAPATAAEIPAESDSSGSVCAMVCRWSVAEIERLLAFTSAVFMINFPLYLAYKHHYHGNAEELSQQEAAILGTYCDVTEAEGIPISIFRNVCFFCDSSGLPAILKCFSYCSTDLLPIPLVHCIVSIVSNVRSWLVPGAVVQHIMPLKPAIVSFMCKLTDDELRMAGNRNLTDMLWNVLKEPTITQPPGLTLAGRAGPSLPLPIAFDSAALALAYKYFTSSTLTLRLAGIGQLNSHIAMYNEAAHADSTLESENVAVLLVQWLLDNKIVEHIFGPNIHIEIIKQSQLVLNLLAAESCLTEEHIDAIWQAALLKHCGRQVQDVLVILIKNLNLTHVTRLARHVAALDPGAHTDHTLFLSSAITKVLWTALISSRGGGSEAARVPALLSGSRGRHRSNNQRHPPMLVRDSSLDQDMTTSDETETSEEERRMVDRIRAVRRKRLHYSLQRRRVGAIISGPRPLRGRGPASQEQSLQLLQQKQQELLLQQQQQLPSMGEHPALVTTSAQSADAAAAEGLALSSSAAPVDAVQPATAVVESQTSAVTVPSSVDVNVTKVAMPLADTSDPQPQLVPTTVEQHFHLPVRSPPAAPPSSDNGSASSDAAAAAAASDDEAGDDMLPSDMEDSEGLGHTADIPAIFVAAAVAAAAGRTMTSTLVKSKLHYKQKAQGCKEPEICRRAGASDDESMEDSSCDLEEKFLDAITSASAGAHVEKAIAEMNRVTTNAGQPVLAGRKRTYLQHRLPLRGACVSAGSRRAGGRLQNDLDDDDMDEDEDNDSCASSQLSAKSEKNMADFEGEDFVSDEELSHIHRQTCDPALLSPSLGDQLGFCVDDVCLPGCTLLWDLIQDDKVHLLPEGLAFEAEKLLCNILCYAMVDKHLRVKFIEACVKNMAANRSVIVSLRLLPRLLSSFQQFRGHADIHNVTMWADRELNMMTVFFHNLLVFRQVLDERGPDRASSIYGLKEDVRVRLHFLSSVYSVLGSPEKFQLTREHVDIIWSCLATHPLTSDQCLSWFAVHAKSRCEFHALDFDSLKYLFTDKMSTLRPESVSMIGFNLYQQLHHVMQAFGLGRDQITSGTCSNSSSSSSSSSSGEQIPATSQVCAAQLWDIALKAQNSDVSAAAVEYLNACYIACGDLEKEDEFVSRCMGSLLEALDGVNSADAVDSSLLAIERGLHLLKTHLESFRQRYAYALRSWQLEAGGIASHQRASQDRGAPVLRLVISAAGLSSFTSMASDKINVEVHSTDYLGEFRAEVTKWWQNIVSQHRKQQQSCATEPGAGGSVVQQLQQTTSPEHGPTPSAIAQSPSIINCLLGSSGPIRIITNGQELTADHDSKTLAELQFKDGQTVFVSVYSGRQVKSRTGSSDTIPTSGAAVSPLSAAAPCGELSTRGKIPMLILLQQPHFDNLFNLLKQLSSPDQLPVMKGRDEAVKRHARTLSRNVWDLLMMLPTNSAALRGLTNISVQWPNSVLPAAPWHTPSPVLVSSTIGSCGDGLQPSCVPSVDWQKLLDASCAPKLLYCLQIVEALSQGAAVGSGRRLLSLSSSGRRRRSAVPMCQRWPPAATLLVSVPQPSQRLPGGGTSGVYGVDMATVEGSGITDSAEEAWSRQFVSCGGLRRLFDIFASGCLQAREGEVWSEWSQEALAYLLRLMIQFATAPFDLEQAGPDRRMQSELGSKKKLKKPKLDNVIVPVLNQELVPMLRSKQNEVLHILTTVIKDAAAVPPENEAAEKNIIGAGCVTPVWSRADVVHFALSFLVSWAYADSTVKDALSSHPEYSSWVKSVTLEAPESEIRLEACRGLYRLCLGRSADGSVNGHVFLPAMLLLLLDHLPEAVRMKPAFILAKGQGSEGNKTKESAYIGSASSEYLWLLCRLVDGLACSPPCSVGSSDTSAIDSLALCAVTERLDVLCHSLAEFIATREFYETRHNSSEDDGLRCLLELLTAVLKHNPTFKFSADGQKLVEDVFFYLFALPTMQHRHLPKCKSHASRSAAYDVVVELAKGCMENYNILHRLLLEQHRKDSHAPYPWDYWPQDDVRSGSGYVGLTNLGATCYMATCMQHLYMIPQARQCLLQAEQKSVKEQYKPTLAELQRMFAYLLESERKAYNPRSFCKVYMMHQQPLNTGEQKDMTEFFTDLIGKLEEMSPDLKKLVKGLFGGVLSNNVVSRDCPHISRTVEEFYTVRCQVADMKSLYESLDEICVKDVLEGDNMYTCSQCQKKVRAEKRACFKRLPRYLCFNTMRYTFNMLTMQKEKINTHFSFPMQLDMSDYMEGKLLQQCEGSAASSHEPSRTGMDSQQASCSANQDQADDSEDSSSTEYELIGVTVHTGNADGGHYYSFIRDRLDRVPDKPDKWYLFNDAEVKPFDPAQLAAECFGGETTSKTYDTITEKFMDFSYEKTNSAYMLFYERVPPSLFTADNMLVADAACVTNATAAATADESMTSTSTRLSPSPAARSDAMPLSSCNNIVLPVDLAEWIWHDNMEFLHDKSIFDSTYIGFMFQMCGYIPTTLVKPHQTTSALSSAQSPPGAVTVTEAAAAAAFARAHLAPAVQLTASFLLETFIHAREKPNMVQWIELLTKQFNQCHDACEWFLRAMARDDWWPQQILISCPNQVVRQMFQRLVIHVVGQLRPNHCKHYLVENRRHHSKVAPAAALSAPASPAPSLTIEAADDGAASSGDCAVQCSESSCANLGTSLLHTDSGIQAHPSVVAQFIAKMLRLLENRSGPRQAQQLPSQGVGSSSSSTTTTTSSSSGAVGSNTGKYMSEYFSLLLDFSKLGDEERRFLLSIGAISKMVAFYMGTVNDDAMIEIGSDDDNDDDFLAMPDSKLKVASLERMIQLIAVLVEHSRDECGELELSVKDKHSLIGGKGFPFLISQIRDNINLKQTCNLVLSLTRWDDALASEIVMAIFGAITRFGSIAGSGDSTQPFFKLLTMLTELAGAGPPGTPTFTHLVLLRIWEMIEHCAQPCLEWLATLVCRQASLAAAVLQHLDAIVEPFLMAHSSLRVRNAASMLLVSLVPSHAFRQTARNTRSVLSPHKELSMTAEAVHVLHVIYKYLLGLLARAKTYVDVTTYGTTNLVAYFTLLTMCLVSRTEKQLFTPYFMDLWHVYQPKMTEPPISINHNKQALLSFWFHVSVDCPENVKLITSNAMICKNIAFNYILADHDDQDIMLYNRCMLPSYYGLLRLCCQRSRPFTRQLAQHQNVQWALQHVIPYASHYALATEELYRLMQLMVTVYPDSTDEEVKAVLQFKQRTLHMFQQTLNARSEWQTLINVLKILLDKEEEKLHFVLIGGLHMCTEAFGTLHTMYHEATACHVVNDLVDLLNIFSSLVRVARLSDAKEIKPVLSSWKERTDVARHCITLLHSYAPVELRKSSLEILRELVLLFNADLLYSIVTLLSTAHCSFQEASAASATSHGSASAMSSAFAYGPYFPRRGHKASAAELRLAVRPPRPQFGMFLNAASLEAKKGVDPVYDQALSDFFLPYYLFVDLLVRVAVNQKLVRESLVMLSAIVAYESAPLHAVYFPKLWCEIYCAEAKNTELTECSYIRMLCHSPYLIDYMDTILNEERTALNNQHVYQFFCNFFPKVHKQVLTDRTENGSGLIGSIIDSLQRVETLKVDMVAGTLQSDGVDIQQMASRANGDIRALLIIYSVCPPAPSSSSPAEPGCIDMPPVLLRCLNTIELLCGLYYAQQKRLAVAEASDIDLSRRPAAVENADASAVSEACSGASDAGDDHTDCSGKTPSKRRRLECEASLSGGSLTSGSGGEGSECAPIESHKAGAAAEAAALPAGAESCLADAGASCGTCDQLSFVPDQPDLAITAAVRESHGDARTAEPATASSARSAASCNSSSQSCSSADASEDSNECTDATAAASGSGRRHAAAFAASASVPSRIQFRQRATPAKKPSPVDVISNSVKSLKDMFASLAASAERPAMTTSA